MEFKQFATNLDRFKYVIEDTGVRLIKKGITSSSDTFVDFEDIGSKIIIEKKQKLLWLFLSLLFLSLCVAVFINRLRGGKVGNGAELFHLAISIMLSVVFLITKKNAVFLAQSDNTNALEFIGTKRYKQRVDAFIKTILQRRDAFLISKYSTIDEFLPYSQQYNNLVWLYNLKLLTKEELRIKIAELDKIDDNSTNGNRNGLVRITGFRNHPQDEGDMDEEDDG